jgi:short-subunit dehydrogenase
MNIRGKTILITGASEGIGASSVGVLRRRGARLSLVARSEEKLNALAAEGDLVTAGDLTDAATRERCVANTIDRFGSLDILINNAGVGVYGPTVSSPMPALRRMTEVNLFVPLEMIQLVVPHMESRGGGMLVNVGSIAGKVTLPWMTVYSATKYAVGSLGDGLRMELADKNIHVMTVCPGYVRTRFQGNILAGQVPLSVQRSKKFGITPEQCAEAIARGIEREKRTVMAPPIGWVLVALERLLPGGVEWQLRRLYRGTG